MTTISRRPCAQLLPNLLVSLKSCMAWSSGPRSLRPGPVGRSPALLASRWSLLAQRCAVPRPGRGPGRNPAALAGRGGPARPPPALCADLRGPGARARPRPAVSTSPASPAAWSCREVVALGATWSCSCSPAAAPAGHGGPAGKAPAPSRLSHHPPPINKEDRLYSRPSLPSPRTLTAFH